MIVKTSRQHNNILKWLLLYFSMQKQYKTMYSAKSFEKYCKWWMNSNLPPGGGTTWSNSLGLVLFQIFLMTALSSELASSMLPSVLMCSDVRTTAKRVALNSTVPSLFKGMFMDTRRWKYRKPFEEVNSEQGVQKLGL